MRRVALLLTMVGALAACNDSTGPTELRNVAISFATQQSGAGPAAAPGLSAAAAGANALVLTSVQLVLREIELERVEVTDCDVEPEPDGCEKFEAGPVLVSLPLDGSVAATFDLDIPTGSYREVEFDIHKISSGDPADAAFLAANPQFVDLSIRAEGTFDGADFVYETDLDVEQELDLIPLLVVDENTTSTNLTILVDLDGWFRDATGAVVDPETANKGGENENLVKGNIEASIDAFEDEDRDGIDGS